MCCFLFEMKRTILERTDSIFSEKNPVKYGASGGGILMFFGSIGVTFVAIGLMWSS